MKRTSRPATRPAHRRLSTTGARALVAAGATFTAAAAVCACWKPSREAFTLAASIGAAAAFACALLVIARTLRAHHRRVEQLLAARRFPHCHVKRLHSGTWFLTDRSTGREYRPGPY
ncbi:hypothetical protein [Paraburkholderia megapolitana]|uniref:hypothetical protein n=1 Tax=Paraburkholderia megapolitana TaxID=420953 RepID=UPI0038BDBCA6